MFWQHHWESEKLTFLVYILDQVYAVIMESAVFCCISKIFFSETQKFLLDYFYWNLCWNRYKNMDGRVKEGKWEPFYWDVKHQSHVISEQRRKVLSISLCVIRSDLLPNFYRGNSQLICSVARDYHQINKVKYFLGCNIHLRCLSDFKKLSRPRKHLWSDPFFKKRWRSQSCNFTED